MKEHPVKWFVYVSFFALLFFSSSGTGTELTQRHVEDVYKGKPVSDILVIAITPIGVKDDIKSLRSDLSGFDQRSSRLLSMTKSAPYSKAVTTL